MTDFDKIHRDHRKALIEQHKDFLDGKVVLEFGVYHGTSMAMFLSIYEELGLPREFVGFDSFQGIPEEKHDPIGKKVWGPGAFSTQGKIPEALQQRNDVTLVAGFFEDSLTDELAESLRGKQIGLIHVDCDTYSSTMTVWRWLIRHNLVSAGTLIVYDDWGGYREAGVPEFSMGESKAHKEMSVLYKPLFTDLGGYVLDATFYEVKIFQCNPLTYRVDVDDTICFYGDEREYGLAEPNHENIAKINALYDKGHSIIYWTARGSRSGVDWSELTAKQLAEWGAKFHEVQCNKLYFDVLIDDRALRIEEV